MSVGGLSAAIASVCVAIASQAWAQVPAGSSPAAPTTTPAAPPAAPPAALPSQSSAAAPGSAPAPTASAEYEDRLIEGGRLEPATSDIDDRPFNADGWPRAIRIDAVASTLNNTRGGSTNENGFVVSGRLDTPQYGSLSLDGTLRTQPGGGVLTLLQRGMPFEGGWLANNGVGMLNTPGIDLSRSQYRFYLPTFPVVGGATEWFYRDELQLQASIGEPGVFNGLRLPGFTRLGGTVATAGAQWAISPQWQVGLQVADARDVNLDTGTASTLPNISGRSMFGSAAWQNATTHLQLNVLDSAVNGGPHRFGAWFDGWTRTGRYTQNYGLFRLDPDMVWGYIPVTSDLEGGYYRLYYQSQQWLWDAGFDAIHSVSGAGVDGVLASGSIRYQVDRSLGIGGGGAYRHSGIDAGSAYVFVDKQSVFGVTRVQLDGAVEAGDRRSAQITYDQSWPLPVGTRLTTSLAAGRATGDGDTVNQISVALLGGTDISNNVSLDGNVRWLSNSGSLSNTGVYANINLTWRIDSRWSLSTTYYENQAIERQVVGLQPLIPVADSIITTNAHERALFIVLRFEDRAGTALAALGGAPGGGAGAIAGYVFLDGNDDGRRDANDVGAASVTVLLDGRFSTRTDRDGRFEFALVGSGTHTITVVPDNLPLPWTMTDNGKRLVQVRTRETSEVEIPARRLR